MLKPEEAFHFRWQFYCIATRFASKYMDAIEIAKLMSRYQMQYIGVCVIVMSNTPHCRFEQNPSKYKIQIRKFMQMVYMYKKVSFEFENQDFVKMMQLEAMIMQAIHKKYNQVYWTCKRHGDFNTKSLSVIYYVELKTVTLLFPFGDKVETFGKCCNHISSYLLVHFLSDVLTNEIPCQCFLFTFFH